MIRFRLLLFGAAVARIAFGQSTDTAPRISAATVSGIVRDSISEAALPGAVVQLIPAQGLARSARTGYSDWLGRFSFSGVPAGRYTIGFFHPILDSLGVEAPAREVIVAGDAPVSADLATPSPVQLRSALCGARNSGGVVVGVVRDAADGSPLPSANVTGQWIELSFTKKGIVRQVARLVSKTGEDGRFTLCNVPSAGTISLLAAHRADSTDWLELEVPEHGVVRRELSIGLAQGDESRGTSPTFPPPLAHRATLSGIVVSADGGKPLAGAEVRVSRGFRTRTNENGEWLLRDVPSGSRMLEVRALGYSPERKPVDVVRGAPPVRVALGTSSEKLEAVRVSAAARLHIADLAGFHQRRRNGAGHYLTAADIERRGDLFTSDIFGSMPGLQLGYASDTLPAGTGTREDASTGNKLVLMRSVTGEWCAPGIYLNGILLPGVSAGDVNTLITTKQVAGIEVYTAASVPAQFKQTMTGCGVVAIWRK